jgi:hypothetical protein
MICFLLVAPAGNSLLTAVKWHLTRWFPSEGTIEIHAHPAGCHSMHLRAWRPAVVVEMRRSLYI